jgi:hypothetical protein
VSLVCAVCCCAFVAHQPPAILPYSLQFYHTALHPVLPDVMFSVCLIVCPHSSGHAQRSESEELCFRRSCQLTCRTAYGLVHCSAIPCCLISCNHHVISCCLISCNHRVISCCLISCNHHVILCCLISCNHHVIPCCLISCNHHVIRAA